MDSIIKKTQAHLAAAVGEELGIVLPGILDEYGPRKSDQITCIAAPN